MRMADAGMYSATAHEEDDGLDSFPLVHDASDERARNPPSWQSETHVPPPEVAQSGKVPFKRASKKSAERRGR
eukprot:6716401-Prorocentrum_lima.AAC.1